MKKFRFHTDRANYYLEKMEGLPEHARRRHELAQKFYHFHMEERFAIIADTSGVPSQMELIP